MMCTGSLRRLLLLAGSLLLMACGGETTASGPPNVLVIVMDTTRGDRVSVTGYERPTTPRLAAFAEDAVVFRDADRFQDIPILREHAIKETEFGGLCNHESGQESERVG